MNSYLCHYLNQVDYHDYVTGTTRLKLNQGRMKELPLVLAPLPEQRRIVDAIEAHFSRLDAAVEALKRTQANLRRYRASVLKAACEGRLVPTEAELARAEGRTYEPADVLLERILAERRRKWEKENPGKKYKEPEPPDVSELPGLPEGWVWATINAVSSKVTDGTHSTPRYVSNGIPFISVNNISNGGIIDFSNCKYITLEEHRTLFSRCNPEFGDVLLTKVGTVGRSAVVRVQHEFSIFVNTALIKPISRNLSADFLAIALRCGFTQGWYDSYIGGSTQRFIGNGKIASLSVPLPPIAEQHRIVDEVERRLSVIDALEATVAPTCSGPSACASPSSSGRLKASWCRRTPAMSQRRCCWSGYGPRRIASPFKRVWNSDYFVTNNPGIFGDSGIVMAYVLRLK